ncbi:MAG TPA: MFS transporter [Methylomirabilota bacterium]|nr:MFS transporter [Methylomirabilota bacterium]
MPVLLAALGALLMSLDSAINIALPAMAAGFEVGAPAIRWVIICYVLTYALTAFAAGLLADRLGPRPVFATGLWLSALAFLGYALADSYAWVLLLRVAQGLGGGLVYGTAPALVTLSLPREFHGRGLGTMGLGLGIGLGTGPLIGGLLLQSFGWSATFLFRAPLFVAVAVLAHVGLGAVGDGAAAPRGVTLSDLFRLPVLRAAAMAFLSNHAQFTVWLLMPFFLVGPLGLSASLGGLVFALTPLGAALAAPLGGRATDRIGPYAPLVGGLVLEVAGLLAIARTTTETPLPLIGAGMALVGLGVGLFQVPNLAQMMAAFPSAQQGVAGGLGFLSRTLGSAMGVQISAALFEARLARDGFLPAFHGAFLAAGLVCTLAVVVALLPGRTR